MAQTFYWYDLETSGTLPKWDRIVQFAGVRTDADLNVIGDEYCTYVQLADDVLPNPEASLVTGITPQLTYRQGIPEIQALRKIHELFTQPETCVVGYNSLRFDDEFIRYSFYRNMLDPYAREWQQGNSRWDIIDLVRATGGLRRDGIEWPRDDDDLPVYKLEELTKANGIDHGHAHDAMSDVHATIGMARLIKQHQPKLFDYYFGLKHKKQVRAALEPIGSKICVHVSGMYPRHRFGVAPILPIAAHPSNSNSVIVVDLAEDVEDLLSDSAESLKEKLFTAGHPERPPLKEIRLNRCPFIAPLEVLNEENLDRLQINMRDVKERARRLKQPGLAMKIAATYQQPRPKAETDPDAALYDAFLAETDRSRCRDFHDHLETRGFRHMDFEDTRLQRLSQRLKARSFAAMLEPEEAAGWQDFVVTKLESEGGWLNINTYEQRLEQLLLDEQSVDDVSVNQSRVKILQALAEHGMDIRSRYRL